MYFVFPNKSSLQFYLYSYVWRNNELIRILRSLYSYSLHVINLRFCACKRYHLVSWFYIFYIRIFKKKRLLTFWSDLSSYVLSLIQILNEKWLNYYFFKWNKPTTSLISISDSIKFNRLFSCKNFIYIYISWVNPFLQVK